MNSEASRQKGKGGFLAVLEKLSVNQRIALGFLVVLVLMLPVAMYALYQQTQLLSRASHEAPATPPVPVAQTISILPRAFGGNSMGIDFYLELPSSVASVDGIQFVGYIEDKPDLFTIEDTELDLSENTELDKLSVVSNSIVREPEKNRYRVTLALISSNPSNAYFEKQSRLLGRVKMKAVGQPNPEATFYFMFDQAKTKVVASSTGENIAGFLPNTTIAMRSMMVGPTPTATPLASASPVVSPTPSSTPVVTPSPTPVASVTPTPGMNWFNTKAAIIYKMQGYSGPNSVYPNMPSLQSAEIDVLTGAQLYRKVESQYASAALGLLLYKGEYLIDDQGSSRSTIVYIKPEKHLSVAIPLNLITNQTAVMDISQTPIKAGDINGDNVIDVDDYHKLVRVFDPVGEVKQRWEDLNYDGRVDLGDYELLATNFDPNFVSPVFDY